MTPVDAINLTPAGPDARLVVYALNQPPYRPLPTYQYPDGAVYSEWEPTEPERAALAAGGRVRVRLWQMTHGAPLQPVNVELVVPPPRRRVRDWIAKLGKLIRTAPAEARV